MKLTPAQEVTLWEMLRLTRGAPSGWASTQSWNAHTLRALSQKGLVEFRPLDPSDTLMRRYVRLTDAGQQRAPTL